MFQNQIFQVKCFNLEIFQTCPGINAFIPSVCFHLGMKRISGKQDKIEYLENPVNFGKPRKYQNVKQNLGLKGLRE